MRRMAMMAVVLAAGPAMGQGLPQLPGGIPGLGGGGAATQGNGGSEFCQRVGRAAMSCRSGGIAITDLTGLGTCLVRTLPAADSMRVAQAAQRAQGNPSSVLTECGVR
ncbi:hypothetical protein ACQW02_19450 [Humitalea sp. 24SJ18S-53]|uniref:hypothetical protein n=1 Tax=Humitalea sp. 24SJ18S-53 TaxID=3422307 RepID=UPI003D66CC99